MIVISLSAIYGTLNLSVSYERLSQSCVDFITSIIYWFASTFLGVNDMTVTVTQIHKVNIKSILPFSVDEFLIRCNGYFDRLFNGENFQRYSLEVLLNVTVFLSVFSFVFPILIGIISEIKSFYLMPGDEDTMYQDTRQLKAFKKFFEPIFLKMLDYIKSFISFLSEKRIYLKILIIIWALNYNLIPTIITFVSYYFYIVSSMDVLSLPVYASKLLFDIFIILLSIPFIISFVIIYGIITKMLKERAYAILQHNEMKNRGFINEQPLGTLGCATMGAGKTSLSVDMALSTSAMFKDKALDILIKNDMKFPNFPWLRFENDLKKCYANHIKRRADIKVNGKSDISLDETIYNLASSKYWVVSKAQKFLKNPCPENLWGYDFERYRTEYDDDLKITDLFETLITYSKAYLIYITQSSLIFSNFSIREDMYCDNGYLPLWNTDFFHRSPAESDLTSRFSKILDFDLLRLGKKMNESNKETGAFEFGIIVITEIGKERGNAKENREMKKKDDKANPNNDGFEYSVKMIRHRATVDFFPFVRIISDEQRPESLGANTRDTFSIIQIVEKSELKVLYKGLFFDGFIHDILYPKFKAFYTKMRNLRGDNTLLVHFLKNIFSFTENRYNKLVNRFGFYVMKFETVTGRLNNTAIESKYYLSTKKAYSDRFQTDCYGDFFEQMAFHSGIGIMDFIPYRDRMQANDELELQNSYFYIELSLFSQFDNV